MKYFGELPIQDLTIKKLPEKIREYLGLKNLLAFPESEECSPVPSNLEDFVSMGNYPPYLFDTI